MLFFFFQAEDGIRDRTVTGVQTCALPISRTPPTARRPRCAVRRAAGSARRPRHRLRHPAGGRTHATRSEERRVGKECRSRLSPEHEKKKNKEEDAEQREVMTSKDRQLDYT